MEITFFKKHGNEHFFKQVQECKDKIQIRKITIEQLLK